MTILITGGTGFIGSYIVKNLSNQGHELVLLKRSFSSTSRIKDVISKIRTYDIDQYSLEEIFSHHKFDQIIHLATAYGRDNDYHKVFDTNLNFPMQLLILGLNQGLKRFISTDTFSSKMDVLDYLKTYHLSKRQFHQWGEQIAEAEDLEFVNVYLQHPYGPMDGKKKFTSFIMESLLGDDSHIDLTEGKQTRDFVYVEDVADAYLTLVNAESIPEGDIDLGAGTNHSIRSFVELAKEVSDNDTIDLRFGALPTRGNEIMNPSSDLSVLKLLGWTPKTDLREGLGKLYQWHKQSSQTTYK